MRSIVFAALALWVPACGWYTSTQTRTQEFSVVTRPAGAHVSAQDGSMRRNLGVGPLVATGKYEVEVTYFNRWWWLSSIISAGVTGVGAWLTVDTNYDGGTMVLGPIVITYGVMCLAYSLWNNIAGEMDHGTERVLSRQMQLEVNHPGFDSKSITVDLPSKQEILSVELTPSWYRRYGFELETDLDDPGAVPALIRALSDEQASTRLAAVEALVEIGPSHAHVERGLRWAVDDPNSQVKRSALLALRKLDTARMSEDSRQPTASRTTPPPPAIVAVLGIQDRAGSLGAETRAQFSRYLAASVSRVSDFRVIPPGELRHRLSLEKKKSFDNCYDDACRIELGKALAAQKVLATDLLRMGERCVLTASLYELRTETVEKSALVEVGCSDEALMDGVKSMTNQLSK